MKRAEQIEQAAKRYVKDIVTPLPASLMTAFIKGAEYADRTPIHYDGKAMLYVLNKGHEQGYKDAINKACEFLKKRMWESTFLSDEVYVVDGVSSSISEFIRNFKDYMEENK